MRRSSRSFLLRVAGIVLVSAAAAPLDAQVQAPVVPVGPLTLKQVLEFAEARSEAIALAEAGVRRAEGEQTRARSGSYPQLSASASYDRSLASEFEGVFDNQDLPGAGDGDGGFEDLPFGRANTWRVSLAFTQSLYTGGRQRAQEAIAAAGQG